MSEDLKLTYPFSWPTASLSGLAGDSGECLLEVGAGKTELVREKFGGKYLHHPLCW